MERNKPIVSIILPTFNRGHLILETLDSIRKQSFNDWECLIIDDGSRDNTEHIVESIINEDGRFKFLYRSENYKKGPSGCRNYGLDIALGSYIVFFDSDDIVHPDLLKITTNLLEKILVPLFADLIKNHL